MRRPQVILLDLDDTILDDSGGAEPAWRAVCAEAAEELGRRRSGRAVRGRRRGAHMVLGRPGAPSHRPRRPARRQPVDPRGGAATDRASTRRTDSPTAWPAATARCATSRSPRSPARFRRSTTCGTAGFRLGLITNGAADVQRAKIERFDLARHFDYIGIEGERGFGKPDPRAYRAALDALGCRPEDAWMAGDRLDWDVLAPMDAGIAGVWVEPGRPAGGRRRGRLPDRADDRRAGRRRQRDMTSS